MFRRYIVSIAAMLTLFVGTTTFASAAGGQDDDSSFVLRFGNRPWLGVRIADISSERIDLTALPRPEGAYILKVVEGSPADSAGLREGDVVQRLGEREIYDAEGLAAAVRRADVDVPIRIEVIRDGNRHDIHATLRERPRRFAFRLPHCTGRPHPFSFEFDLDEYEMFGPEGAHGFSEQLRRDIESSLRPSLEELRAELKRVKERLQDMDIEIGTAY
jgi:hypothetical protein